MKYGAKGAKWAPMTTEGTATVKPTYGEALEFDGLNEVNETLNMATGSAYGDNQEKIFISEFSNGEATVKAVFIPYELSEAILGTTGDSEGGLEYGQEDNQPFGAYGFYRTLMDAKKNKYYEVNFYPKVQGSIEGSTSKTKEDGVTLEYDAIKLRIQSCNNGTFKIEKRFKKETAAIEYLAGLFEGTSAWPSEKKSGQADQGGSAGESGENTAGGSTEGNEDQEVTA